MKSLQESQTSYSIETSDLSFNKEYIYKGTPKFDQSNNIINKEANVVNNFSSRGDYKISYIVYHHTACDFETAIEDFTQGAVSAHYLINYEGDIYHLVDDQYKAWHAGKGQLAPNSVLNSENIAPDTLNCKSIGIELVNNGREEFTSAQYDNLIKLSGLLQTKHDIPKENFIGHLEWTQRKNDPSPYFKTDLLAKNGFGLYPNIRNIDQEQVKFFISSESQKFSSTLSQVAIEEFKTELALASAMNQYGYFIDHSQITDKSFEESLKTLDKCFIANLQNSVFRYLIKFHGQDIINDSHAKELWDQHCTVNTPAEAEIIKEELAEYCYNHCDKVEILTEILSMLELVGN